MIKNLLISFLLGATFSLSTNASVMKDGEQFLALDYSMTSADKLWVGNGNDRSYNGGETTYINYGLSYGRGFGSGLQLDLRLGYATSEMSGGNFGLAADGDKEKDLNEVSLKLTYNLITNSGHSTNIFFKYQHPGANTEPTGTKFIALNDFTTQYIFGFEEEVYFNRLVLKFDVNYALRSSLDAAGQDGLPGNQLNASLTSNYSFTNRIIAGAGFVYRSTEDGLTLPLTNDKFYAAKEKFFGYSLAGTYSFPESQSFVGLTRFSKTSGRNTDQSTTWSAFYGFSF